VDYQLGKSVALHRGHLRISWPAARLARWPWERPWLPASLPSVGHAAGTAGVILIVGGYAGRSAAGRRCGDFADHASGSSQVLHSSCIWFPCARYWTVVWSGRRVDIACQGCGARGRFSS